MSQPVQQKKARVSLLCSSEECWELFALSASTSAASGQLAFAVSVFRVAPYKEHSGFGVVAAACLS